MLSNGMNLTKVFILIVDMVCSGLVSMCARVSLSEAVLTEQAAIPNRLFSLLSLTPAQRLNSHAAEKDLDDSNKSVAILVCYYRGMGVEGGTAIHFVYLFI